MRDAFCVKVTGRAVIEDYERIKSIALSFPQIADLVNRSIENGIKTSVEYIAIKNQLEAAEAATKAAAKSSQRAQTAMQLKDLKQSLTDVVAKASKVAVVEQWILDGLKTWIETFLPGIINLRMYPSVHCPDEHILGNLKAKCFEESDVSSFHFTYGSIPT